jgi:hypothetical protein
MPTLIRIVVFLLVLGGLAFGAMFALVIFVEPADKEVTVRIPARDLLPAPERDPLVLREIDTSRAVGSPPPDEPAAAVPDNAPDGVQEEGDVVTLSPGVE